MSLIGVSEIPAEWEKARVLLTTLQHEFNRRQDSRFGNARASLRRRRDETLVALAQKMVALDAMIETMHEAERQR